MLHISVWLEIMVPVMTMKHYSKFVVNYLVQLLRLHKVRNTHILLYIIQPVLCTFTVHCTYNWFFTPVLYCFVTR